MKNIHIYSHTHWDYEWYFTQSESIIQLIYHMDEVLQALQEGSLQTYLLDSQVSILEEYLYFMPEKSAQVKQLVKDGKLMIGPWFTQSDELIISGESLVRNLYYGMKYSNSLGSCMKVGYLPDSFGQSQDMPKIYAGFGIKDCLFWRGVPSDVCKRREFKWQSVDGSEVLTYNIRDGYFFGGNLIYSDDVHQIEKRLLDHAICENQLLSVGGDQRYVDFNLHERIQYYNTHTTHDLTYIESDLETFFKELRLETDLPTIQGEFIDASVSKIHRSIYSSRYDHKFMNDKVERRLIYQIEPFMVMQQIMGITPKLSVLEKAWKKLLLNHAHDSACGCNSDETNRSIAQRLDDCDQMTSMLLDYQVRKTSESLEMIKDNDIVFYNTIPYARNKVQVISVSTKQKEFKIVDEFGKRIAFDLRNQKRIYGGSIRKDTSQYSDELFYYESSICLCVSMDAMSMRIFHIVEDTSEQVQNTKSDVHAIENNTMRITIENGKLTLFDKLKHTSIEDFLYVEDSGDDGDTYDYSYPFNDWKLALDFEHSTIHSIQGKLAQVLQIEGTFHIPYNLADRENKISNCSCAYHLEITLSDDEVIQCHMAIDNKAVEHRLRVVCRSNINAQTSLADTPFGTIERKNEPTHKKDWKQTGYREEPSPIYPMLHHVSIYDRSACLTMYSLGIKEYEVLDNNKLALTLYRSVGYLGKPDLERRPGIASGNEFRYVETVDSQLLKKMEFHFAISFCDNVDAMHIQKTYINYASDVLYYQIQEHNRFINTQKYFVTHPYRTPLKKVEQFMNLDHLHHACLSTLLPLDNNEFILRIYNTSLESLDNECVYIHIPFEVCEVNLLHEPIDNKVIKHKDFFSSGKIFPQGMKSYKISIK